MVSIEAVWDRTSEFLGDHLGSVLRIAVPLVFVPMAAMGIVMPLIGPAGGAANLVLGLVAVALGVVMIWGNLALSALVLEPAAPAGAVRLGVRRLPAAVLVSLLEMIVAVLLILPIFMAFYIGGGGAVAARMPMAGGLPTIAFGPALFILLYGAVYALGAVVLVARLLLFDAVLVAEGRGVAALPRAFGLTRGLTLKLVGVLLLYLLVSQVAALATKTVFGAMLGLFTLGDDTVTVATVVTSVLVAVVQTGFSVLATVFAARLYVAVRDVRGDVFELA